MRPDLWLTETTTPGLVVQTDINSGESEPLFAGAATLRQTQGQDDTAPGLLLELAALRGQECAKLSGLLQPITEARTTSSTAEAHTYFFGTEQGNQQEQSKRLRLLSRELELTATHIRRVLEEK